MSRTDRPDIKNIITNLTISELEDNLITADYKGKEFKALCLQELINKKLEELTNTIKEYHE